MECGWRKDGDMICPTTVSAGSQLVPVYIQKIISCSCSSDTPCESINVKSMDYLLSLLCLSATGRRNSMSPDRNIISPDSDDDTSDEGQVIITRIDDVYDIRICNFVGSSNLCKSIIQIIYVARFIVLIENKNLINITFVAFVFSIDLMKPYRNTLNHYNNGHRFSVMRNISQCMSSGNFETFGQLFDL